MKKLLRRIRVWLTVMRWYQWTKGLTLLIVLYGRSLNTVEDLKKLLLSLVIVTVLSGAIYINNDMSDVERDKQHPTKKLRPFAAGEITREGGVKALALLALLLAGLLLLANNIWVTLLVLLMTGANILYTNWVKKIPYLELFYYGPLSALRYWIGVATLPNPFVFTQSIFLMAALISGLTMLRYMEKERYGSKGRMLLAKYSSAKLKWISLFMGFIAAVSSFVVAVQYTSAMFLPGMCFALFISRLLYLGMRKTEDPEKVDDVDKMIRHDLWLKLLIFTYISSMGYHVVLSFL